MSSPNIDIGRDVISLSSHTDDGAAEVTWLRHNVDTKLC
jgi:hypothetical protein